MSLISTMEMNRLPSAAILHTQLQLHHQMLYRQQNITHHHHHHTDEMPNNGWLLPPSPGAGPALPGDVTVSLQNAKLWQQFHAETTEMIITKLGRRMFPSLQLQIDGLERRSRYCLLLEVAPASRRRHKYVGGGGENGGNSRGWTSAGPAEPQPHVNRRVYLHPDSPATGAHWMQHPISFSKLKLTNNAVDHHSNVVLTSMHKYIPRIWIVRCDDVTRLNALFSQPASSFCFPETEFIAVTAYQNENITKLKIDNNPFAKGFRETGQSRCKRKLHHLNSTTDSSTLEEIHLEDRTYEDEEGNVSSSESESNSLSRSREAHHSAQRLKRAASETGSLDDSGVSSSGSASPPLPTSSGAGSSSPKRENAVPQVRLHRPWADDEETSSPKAAASSSNCHKQAFVPPHHLAAMEFARIQQIHYHQMQYEQYCQLKHLAMRLPFGPSMLSNEEKNLIHYSHPVQAGLQHFSFSSATQPLPACSPSGSTDEGASTSS